MSHILLALYIGGVMATAPTAFALRGAGAVGWHILFLSLGWPLAALGTLTGHVRFKTTLGKDD